VVEAATFPVIVVPRGVTVRFDGGASTEPQPAEPPEPSAPPISA
jgi:hypothetical protein